jgi:RHS repeat-associated protein
VLRDHLGNTRPTFADVDDDQAVDASEILQQNHYYPFGMNQEGAWDAPTNTTENRYQYNGKELNTDFGLNWYDYGARWYDSVLGRWTSVDPLASEMPGWNTYVYALNSPFFRIDPDGRDGRVRYHKGAGTKVDPHIVTISANYYYNKNNFSNDEISAFNSAIKDYNTSSHTSGKGKDGTYTVYKYELSALPVDSDKEAFDSAIGDTFEGASGETRQFGNVLQRGSDINDSALAFDLNGKSLNLNDAQLDNFVKSGGDLSIGLKSTFLHEIGHNLGGEHIDPNPMGAHITISYRKKDSNCMGECPQVPSTEVKALSKKFTPIIIDRINNPIGRQYLDYEKK